MARRARRQPAREVIHEVDISSLWWKKAACGMGKQNQCSERRHEHTVEKIFPFNLIKNVNALCTHRAVKWQGNCVDVNSDVIHYMSAWHHCKSSEHLVRENLVYAASAKLNSAWDMILGQKWPKWQFCGNVIQPKLFQAKVWGIFQPPALKVGMSRKETKFAKEQKDIINCTVLLYQL